MRPQGNDIVDNPSDTSGSTGSGSTGSGMTTSFPSGRSGGGSIGVINQGPYTVAGTVAGWAPGPPVPVHSGMVRARARAANTKTGFVALGSGSKQGYPLTPDTEVIFPADNLSRVYWNAGADGELVDYTIKESD
jgi:hypothetical protein